MVDSGAFSKLPTKLLSKDGEVNTSDVISNDLIGFYFSAHWCPPCRAFTPILAECFDEWKKEGKSIQIIFVSSDRDDKEFSGYFGTMPWTAVPLTDKTAIGSLKSHFGVTGIPKFVVVDKSGNVIDENARGTVTNYTVNAISSWKK